MRQSASSREGGRAPRSQGPPSRPASANSRSSSERRARARAASIASAPTSRGSKTAVRSWRSNPFRELDRDALLDGCDWRSRDGTSRRARGGWLRPSGTVVESAPRDRRRSRRRHRPHPRERRAAQCVSEQTRSCSLVQSSKTPLLLVSWSLSSVPRVGDPKAFYVEAQSVVSGQGASMIRRRQEAGAEPTRAAGRRGVLVRVWRLCLGGLLGSRMLKL